MNQQQAMHSVRKALICAAIEAIEAIPQHGKTYITVMVYDPNAEEKIHLQQILRYGLLEANLFRGKDCKGNPNRVACI